MPPPGQPYWGQRGASNICLQLEQRLVTETQGSGQNRELLPKIEADLRQTERSLNTAQIQLDRADCWDQFLFSKTLRRTPRCVQLNGDVESMRRRLAELEVSADRSWARATDPIRTISSASWRATAAASSIRRKLAGGIRPATPSPGSGR